MELLGGFESTGFWLICSYYCPIQFIPSYFLNFLCHIKTAHFCPFLSVKGKNKGNFLRTAQRESCVHPYPLWAITQSNIASYFISPEATPGPFEQSRHWYTFKQISFTSKQASMTYMSILSPTATFVFFPATTWTRFIPTNFSMSLF